MRWVIGIVVVAVLAFLGYQHFRPESRPPVAAGTVQPAAPGAESATGATVRPAAPAADGAAEAVPSATDERTQAIMKAAESEALQAAREAAKKMQATAEQVAKAAQDVASSSATLEVGDTDIGKGLTDVVNGVTATLGGITDQASAKAAVTKLVAIDARLYELEPKIAQLPDDARKTLAALVTGMLPQVQSATARVEAIAGAGDVVKPALDPIVAKLDGWSREPT
jgi:hypothetical protein